VLIQATACSPHPGETGTKPSIVSPVLSNNNNNNIESTTTATMQRKSRNRSATAAAETKVQQQQLKSNCNSNNNEDTIKAMSIQTQLYQLNSYNKATPETNRSNSAFATVVRQEQEKYYCNNSNMAQQCS
jgi:hypothetical protein